MSSLTDYFRKLGPLKSWLDAHRIPVISAVNALAILFGTSLIAVVSMGHGKFVAEAQTRSVQARSPLVPSRPASPTGQESQARKRKGAVPRQEPVSISKASRGVKAPVKTPAPPPLLRTRLPGQEAFDRTDLPADEPDDSDSDPDAVNEQE